MGKLCQNSLFCFCVTTSQKSRARAKSDTTFRLCWDGWCYFTCRLTVITRFAKKVGSPGVDRRADDTQALPRWGQWASAVWGCLGGGECSAARGEQQTPRRRSSRQPIDHHSHTSTSATGPSRFLPYAAQRRCRCYDCTRLLGIWPDLFVRRNIATVERTKGLCSRLPLALQKQPPARAAIIQNRILA